MKTQAEEHPRRNGRPGQRNFDDVDAARLEANATARPADLSDPTPDQA